ncbi:MAG: hypothetical protein VCC99_04070, partial [Alphaproteobacteria bacterium]
AQRREGLRERGLRWDTLAFRVRCDARPMRRIALRAAPTRKTNVPHQTASIKPGKTLTVAFAMSAPCVSKHIVHFRASMAALGQSSRPKTSSMLGDGVDSMFLIRSRR